MACDHCRSIDVERLYNEKPGTLFDHHSTVEELEACSEATGCQLCEWIRSGLGYPYWSKGDDRVGYFRDNIAEANGFSKITFQSSLLRSLSFEVFVLEGSRLANPNIISGRPVSPYSDSENCFQLAKRWKDQCLEHHSDTCLRRTDQKLPTRVIDVGPSDGSHEPCLKISEGEEGDWVALSHCWGTESRFVLSSNNIASFQKIISFQTLPPTFRDAIIVTRKIGYRYLWIDSLCIIQDSHEDWVLESKSMQDYYKDAILTISADSAAGDHVGFLGKRHQLAPSLTIELTTGDKLGIRKIVKMESHISKRAWTLQEFLLSPRSLQYMPDQLIWECHASKLCESDTKPQDNNSWAQEKSLKRFFSTPSLELSDSKSFQPSSRWYNLVEDYSLRNMTKKDDILPAISGLAREIAQQSGYTYAAGIWIEEICIGLGWYPVRSATAKESDEYHAPSWSWASWPTSPGIAFTVPHLVNEDMYERKATLIRYKIILEDDDKFGRVKSGSIDLRAKCISMRSWLEQNYLKFHYVRDRYDFTKTAMSSYIRKPMEPDDILCFFDSFDENTTSEKISEETHLFHISTLTTSSYTRMYALLLVQVENSPKETYRRVGLIDISTPTYTEEYLMDQSTWEEKEVHII
ncbi:hypothetical protein HYFRA_00006354 [Hymenoscyphus fraxineus]|uniref:Heterokaryon incompatibility domain-containing protein n=1 Tax=Hymenoscyphus fraxineus TaxID=746836 RepID=A0A9N9KRZ0_9HELO|nr:hypothetical protein HYFRA_00006354 [Hymenoscyphus fraxineus]